MLISVCGWGSWAAARGRQVPFLGQDHPDHLPCCWGPGHIETGELQGFPLWPSGGHGALAWEGGKQPQRFQIDDSIPSPRQHCPKLVSNLRQRGEEGCPELHHRNLDPRKQPSMPSEKELQISPIVQESVVHNTKVRHSLAQPWPRRRPCRQLTKPIRPGPRQPPVSDSLPLWCRGRHTRPRVLCRLPLLHRLHPADRPPLLRNPRRPGLPVRGEASLRHQPLFPRAARAMD